MIHQAGPVVDQRQPCAACGVTLKDFTTGSVLTRYPEGALIEVTPVFQAMRLDTPAVNCAPTCHECGEPITAGAHRITSVGGKYEYCSHGCYLEFLKALENQ